MRTSLRKVYTKQVVMTSLLSFTRLCFINRLIKILKPIFVNSLNFKHFEIPRKKYKLSKNESLMQKIFSLIAISALFPKQTHNRYSTYIFFIFILIISIPIKFTRSLIYKFI